MTSKTKYALRAQTLLITAALFAMMIPTASAEQYGFEADAGPGTAGISWVMLGGPCDPPAGWPPWMGWPPGSPGPTFPCPPREFQMHYSVSCDGGEAAGDACRAAEGALGAAPKSLSHLVMEVGGPAEGPYELVRATACSAASPATDCRDVTAILDGPCKTGAAVGADCPDVAMGIPRWRWILCGAVGVAAGLLVGIVSGNPGAGVLGGVGMAALCLGISATW